MIDEKKLIKIFMRKGKDKLKLSTVINEIEMLEKFDALSNSEWISVDDVSKIPKERKVYLVTYVTPTGKKYVRSAECSYSGETPRHIEWSKKLNGTVVAWMSLPEPYRPEKESEQIE